MLNKLFNNHFKKNEDGFTLLEMVIAIPLIAITGGFIMLVIGHGVQTSSNSATILDSGRTVQQQVEKVKKATSCKQLTNLTGKEHNINVSQKNTSNNYTINTEFNPKSTVCKAGTSSTIIIKAVKNIDTSKESELFETTIKVAITE